MSTEMSTVIKKVVPYLQRRGYSLDDNMFFGERAQSEQEQAGFIDILIKRSAKASTALFLIEAKRDTLRLNASHRKQALDYGKTIAVPFVVTTNGLDVELFNVTTGQKLKVNGSVICKVPHYQKLNSVLSQFKANPALDNIDLSGDESLPYRPGLNLPQLQALIRRCHNTIRNVEKDEENVFADVSKFLFLKLLEEKQDRGELGFILPYSYRFYELAQRRKFPDQVKDAILSMIHQVVSLPRYGEVMTPTLHMQKPATYFKVVSELSKANFTDSELDVRGSVFEYFVRISLKGRRLGQFFTPRPLVRLMLSLIPLEQIIPELLDPKATPTVVDPACGSGGFLLAGMNKLLQKVESETGHTYSKDKADWLKRRIKADVFWGADANQRIASTAKMNMIIAGDGFANIRHGDSLTEEVDFLKFKGRTLPLIDFLVTNPPFGMSVAESLQQTDLELYGIQLTKTQALFLQKMVRIVKPGGHICTVIDEGMLNTTAMLRIRKFLVNECFVDAVIQLPDVTFDPNKINVRASVLLLTRKPDGDAIQQYPIRMIALNKLGYNSMGEDDVNTPIESIINLVRARWYDITQIQLSLNDTGEIFRSYPLPITEVHQEPNLRLDFKYYDPETLALIERLKTSGGIRFDNIVCEPIRRGTSPAKVEYNTDINSDIVVVKAGNIGKVSLTGKFDTAADNVYQRLKSAQIKIHDLLLASTGEGTLGKAAVYDRPTKAIADGHVTIIRLDATILPEYAAWYLRSHYGQVQIRRLYTGATGQIELPEDAVKSILILAPKDKTKQLQLANEWMVEVQNAEALEAEALKKREEAHQKFVQAIETQMVHLPTVTTKLS